MATEKILVMGHVQPDGDCISSALAIADYYKEGDTPVSLFLPEVLSPMLRWMLNEVPVPVLTLNDALAWQPERLLVVDCAPTKARTGFPIEEYMVGHPNTSILNIDHHADRLKETPLPYAEKMLQIISPDASSTAEILVVEQELDTPILYIGLATDTLFFKVGHIGSAMQAVMDLHLGDETIVKFRSNLDAKLTIEQIKALASAQVNYYETHGLLVIILPIIDGELNITFINLTRGFDFVAIIQPNGMTSLRTAREDVDLSVFAKKFKGGGHPQAAGCKVEMDKIDNFVTEFKIFISFFTTKFPPIPSDYVTKIQKHEGER